MAGRIFKANSLYFGTVIRRVDYSRWGTLVPEIALYSATGEEFRAEILQNNPPLTAHQNSVHLAERAGGQSGGDYRQKNHDHPQLLRGRIWLTAGVGGREGP